MDAKEYWDEYYGRESHPGPDDLASVETRKYGALKHAWEGVARR